MTTRAEQVKSAARDRWLPILTAAGLPEDCLTGKNCPCPKCGGTDRFAAFRDVAETGGVNCRKCHEKRNGDGIATVQWWRNCTFQEALAFVAEQVGLDQSKPKSNGKPRIVAQYGYQDERGELLFQVVRFEPKDFRQRKPKPVGGYIWSVKGCSIIPYRLPELLNGDQSEIVFIVEGEKDVDRLRSLGLVATCNAGGAGKWKPAHAKHLKNRHVAILADNDDPGRDHAAKVAHTLAGLAASVKIVDLPGLQPKGDVSDWLDTGGTIESLQLLVATAEEWKPTARERLSKTQPADDEEKEVKLSQATIIVQMASDTEKFHNPNGDAFARFKVGDHYELSPMRSRNFRRWLARRFYVAAEKAPSAQALQDAISVLEGQAIYDGPERQVHLRLAEHDGKIYVDLCNEKWQVVEVDANGWRVVQESPIYFRRAKAMLSLPIPATNGDITELRRFANVNDDDWPLLLAWLVAAMRPSGPYPVLAVHGEHGSAKSTLCRYLRSLIDPNTAPLRADYREPRDLMICANNGWVVALDNVSHIPAWLSDCFCRLATGGGFSTRTLYENDEETIFDAKRPLILNCIDEVVTRSDLLDRSLLLNLPRIEQENRVGEKNLDAQFAEAMPRILGGLLSAVSCALRNEKSVRLLKLPRMADFAVWATAAEPTLGLQRGEFLDAYTTNREAGNESAIEASPVGKAIVDLISEIREWSGTSTDLLGELERISDEKTKKLKSWPATARSLGCAIKRLAPNLREAGVGVEFGQTGRDSKKRRCLTLIRTSRESCAPNDHNVPTTGKPGANGDGGGANGVSGGANDPWNDPAETPLFPDEIATGGAGVGGDAKIPHCSNSQEWGEL